MATDLSQARVALRASGMSAAGLFFLVVPLGRERRLQALLRRRQSVLEAKNTVLDSLSRLQKPLQTLALHDQARLKKAMEDPDKRRVILGLSMSRVTLEDEARKWGVELGLAFEQALRELVAERRLLRSVGPSGDDVYLMVYLRARERYDLSELNRLLNGNKDRAHLLQDREDRESETRAGRTYRI